VSKLHLLPMRAIFVVLCLGAASALAKPPGPADFCQKYPAAPVCTGSQPACTYCHTSPPTRNVYGMSVEAHLLPGAPRPLSDADYTMGLSAALAAAENEDSDGDGYTNLIEIQNGTAPSDPESFPTNISCAGPKNPTYNVCNYDPHYAVRKVVLDFCGFSPTYAQLAAFDAATVAEQMTAIDTALNNCLASDLWRGKNGQLWELAHRKIRPVGSLKAGPEDTGVVPLADYYDDYNLFTWTQIDGHDAREILTANYFVARTGANPTVYTQMPTAPIQAVDTAHRAGNMTTAWSLAYFVMFTALPRTAAAQAYRGYLGVDIAKQEGLYPVPGEPKDWDHKGVTGTLCTQCHATLDPLSYPFRNYNGLTGSQSTFGRYVPMRLETIPPFSSDPALAQVPEQGYIFNQPVSDLVQWAQVAANSDQFARATVLDYWKLLMGGPPTSEQNAEFTMLWQRFKTVNNYSVDAMLHELIKTEAYGAP
jgi:hypothetical protein